jgi:hypothetical protein
VETYLGMGDIKVWQKWLDPKSYQVLLDPQTYAYWAQPGAYMHVVNVENYAQLVNPSAYANLMDQGAATMKLAYQATIGSYVPALAIPKPAEDTADNNDD